LEKAVGLWLRAAPAKTRTSGMMWMGKSPMKMEVSMGKP